MFTLLGRRARARPNLNAILVGRHRTRLGATRRAAQRRQAAVAGGARGRVLKRDGRATLDVTTHIVRDNVLVVVVVVGAGLDLFVFNSNGLHNKNDLVLDAGFLVQHGRLRRRGRIHGHDNGTMVEHNVVQEHDENSLNRELHGVVFLACCFGNLCANRLFESVLETCHVSLHH
jgi:hypothetical protein